jgi:hypothetical protein
MSAPVLKPANSQLVGVEWAKRIPSLVLAGVPVAGALPADDAPIRAAGFVTALHVGGGSDLDVPRKRSVIAFSAWAAPPSTGSRKLPLGRAGGIAEWIWEAAYDRSMTGIILDLHGIGGGFADVKIMGTLPISVPRPIYGDPSGFARFDVEIQLDHGRNE